MTVNTWAGFSKGRNSTKQPTGGTQKTMTLKAPTSLINPVMLVENFSLSDNYLQWGNRYYYINDIVLVNNNLAEYHCNVDPLASWKSGIAGMTEFVARSASSYDGKIIDSFYPLKADIQNYGYNTDQTQASFLDITSGGFIVGIIGGEASAAGGVKYYYMMPAEMEDMLNYLFGGAWLDSSETDITLATQKQLVNPFQYIASVNWIPCDIYSIFEYSESIQFGWWLADGSDGGIPVSGSPIPVSKRIFKVNGSVTPSQHPEAASRGVYLNGAPFTSRDFYIWGFGKIVLDPAAFVNGEKLYYTLSIDLYEGSACLLLEAGTSTETAHEIGKYMTSWLVPVQVGQMTQNVVGSVLDTVSVATSVFSGNFGGAASGIGNAIEDIYPRLSSMGSIGSAVGFSPAVPAVVSEFRRQTPMDAIHNGRPLCQNVTIGSLSGYIKTENAEVDLPCTQEERDMIAAYMDGGFYYE